VNRNTLRALFWEAYYQVLDNWVFRILAVLTLLPILLTFVVGLREEGIVLLFGMKRWAYADVIGPLAALSPGDQQGVVIEGLLQVVFDGLAGTFGTLFALAATAFFVPRMLEKGAADVLFQRPISRWMLYLSRYFAGLLFIAILSGLLVGGMYLGFLLVSRHNDPGVLAAGLGLIYLFALIYSFSMLVGVVTRSTVASILLAGLFFMFNGCIHQGWIALKQHEAGAELKIAEDRDDDEREESAASADDAGAASGDEDESDEPGTFVRFLFGTLEVLHYVLPKTSDSEHLVAKLRARLEPADFEESEALLAIQRFPDGLERAAESPAPPPALAELLGEPRLTLRGAHVDGTPVAYTLWRRAAQRTESRVGTRTRTRTETSTQAGERLEEALSAELARPVERASVTLGSGLAGPPLRGQAVSWTSGAAPEVESLAAVVFKGSDEGQVFTLLVTAEGELAPELLDAVRDRLATRIALDIQKAGEWYPDQLAFDAPLPFNILQSVGTSLAFAAAMLFLGWLRLRKIDF